MLLADICIVFIELAGVFWWFCCYCDHVYSIYLCIRYFTAPWELAMYEFCNSRLRQCWRLRKDAKEAAESKEDEKKDEKKAKKELWDSHKIVHK